MATGENFRRINCGSEINSQKEKIQKLKDERYTLYRKAFNTDGGDYKAEIKWEKICKEIDYEEYQLWCIEYEDNRRRNWR